MVNVDYVFQNVVAVVVINQVKLLLSNKVAKIPSQTPKRF